MIFIVCLLCAACHTKRQSITEFVSVEKSDSIGFLYRRIDSLLRESLKRDSIHEKDSVAVMVKGDTVTIDRWHTVYHERSSSESQKEKEIVHDTVFRTEYIDRIIEKEVITEVKKLKTWQITLMWWIGILTILSAFLWLCYRFRSKK